MKRLKVNPLQPIDLKVSRNFEAYIRSGFLTFVTEDIKEIREIAKWEIGDRVYCVEVVNNKIIASSPSGLFVVERGVVKKIREGTFYCVRASDEEIIVGSEEGILILGPDMSVRDFVEAPGAVFSCDIYGDRKAFGTCCEDTVFVMAPYHMWTFKLGDGAWGVSWNPDGEYLAVGSDDGNLYVFSKTGKLLIKRTLALRVRRVSWRRELAAGCYDPGYVFSFVHSNTLNLVWKKRLYNVWGLSWDPSNSLLAAGDADKKSFYILRNGEIIKEVNVDEGVRSLLWKGNKIIVGGEESLRVYEVLKGEKIIVTLTLLEGGKARIKDIDEEYLVET